MKFTKMHGAGNDYIYINCFEENAVSPAELAVRLSDRHFGVGGDGVILICPSETADVRMRMFNADGSEGKMCGNGIRCVAGYAYERGIAPKTEMTVETASGIKKLSLNVDNGKVSGVCVDMGVPSFECADMPAISDMEEFIDMPVEALGRSFDVTCVSMGNPHAVIFVEDVMKTDVETIGRAIEAHPMFPERTNVEFVEDVDDRTLKMRVWERGSGETLACGTGACASLAAAAKLGICGRRARLCLRGGELDIKWNADDGHIYMTGPAEFVFDGEIKD